MEPLDLKQYPVLIVDDEPHILQAIQDALESEFTVLAANNADEALAIIEKERVAVVVSDQRMPGMTGAELLEVVKQKNPQIGRIILSAYDDKQDLLAAIHKGTVSAYLLKPLDKEELLLTVKRELSLSTLRFEINMLNQELQFFSGKILECQQQEMGIRGNKLLLLDQISIPTLDEDRIDATEAFLDKFADIINTCYSSSNSKDVEGIQYIFTHCYAALKTRRYMKRLILDCLDPKTYSADAHKKANEIVNTLIGKTLTLKELTKLISKFKPNYSERLDGHIVRRPFYKDTGLNLRQFTFYTDVCFGIVQSQGETIVYKIYRRDHPDFVIVPKETITDGNSISGTIISAGEYTWRDHQGKNIKPSWFWEEFLKELKSQSANLHSLHRSQQYPILIVDDEEHILSAIKDILKDEFSLLTAINGTKALDLLEQHPISIVVADQVMPGMQGTELLHQVKELYPLTRRLILTAHGDKQNILLAINQALVSGFITKPPASDDFKILLKQEMELFLLQKQLMSLRSSLHTFLEGAMIHIADIDPTSTSDTAVFQDSIYIPDVDQSSFKASYTFKDYLCKLMDDIYDYDTLGGRLNISKERRGITMACSVYDYTLHKKYVKDKIRKALTPTDFEQFMYLRNDSEAYMFEDVVEDRWQQILNADTIARTLTEQLVGRIVPVSELESILATKITNSSALKSCVQRLLQRHAGYGLGAFLIYNKDEIATIQEQPGKIVYKIEPREDLKYVLFPHKPIQGKTIEGKGTDWWFADTKEPIHPSDLLVNIFSRLRQE